MAEKIRIESSLSAAKIVEQTVLRQVDRYGYDKAGRFAIKLALEEGLNNALKHGNGYDTGKTVEVCFDITAERAEITIADQGQGFNPADVPDPTADENIEKPCGRGIMLMRAYMDEVRYNPVGNQVYMVKRHS